MTTPNDREQSTATDTSKAANRRRFLKETFDLLKRAFSVGSKIFVGITVINVIVALFQGTVDANVEGVIDNLMVVFTCVIAFLIFYKTKLPTWLRYLLAYVSVVLIMLVYILFISGAFTGEGNPIESLINVIVFTTIAFVAIDVADRISDRIKAKSNDAECSADTGDETEEAEE